MGLLKRGMKWYCSPFPFGSFCVFVKLCQIAEPEPCAVGASLCVWERWQERERGRESLCSNVRCRNFFEGRIIPLCLYVSEDNLNYNCIAAQSRNSSQAQAKPCWTRLNQAWTYSPQHALRFKPWLIGPKASKSPFPAVTGTGLGKERDGRKRKKEESQGERQREITFPRLRFHLHEPPLDQYRFVFSPFLFDILSIRMHNLFLLAQLVREPQMLRSPGCSLWVKSDVWRLSTTRQSGQLNRRSVWRGLHWLLQRVSLPVYQFWR